MTELDTSYRFRGNSPEHRGRRLTQSEVNTDRTKVCSNSYGVACGRKPINKNKLIMALSFILITLGFSPQLIAQTVATKQAITALGMTTGSGANWSTGTYTPDAFGSSGYREATLTNSNSITRPLSIGGFGFGAAGSNEVPVDAIISKVEAKVWKSKGNSTSRNIQDVSLGLYNSTTLRQNFPVTTAAWATSSTAVDYVITSPTVTAAQIRATDFGIRLVAQRFGGTGGASSPEARFYKAELTITYTLPSNPDIVLSATSVSLSSTYGSVSTSSFVNVSGSDLSANITATLNNSAFEISTDNSTWTTSPITYNQSSGVVSSTPLYIRTLGNQNAMLSTASLTNVVTFTSTGATAENLNLSYVVNQKSATVTANNDSKCFDATITGGTVPLASARYTVAGLLGSDAAGTVNLASSGFPAYTAASSYPIFPSALTLSSGNIDNYIVTYANGTLTVSDEVKGRISGASNTSICNGSVASINLDQFGGGVPSTINPFRGEFWIKKDGTSDSVAFAFDITGGVFSKEIPSSYLTASTITTKYKIYWKSLDNNQGCSTSSTSSLTGSVEITVHPVPTLAIVSTVEDLSTVCSNDDAVTFTVNNPNSVLGASYDMTVNYNGVTGGLYTAGLNNHAFGTLTEGVLINNTNAPLNVVYTFSPKNSGTPILCTGTSKTITYTVNPTPKFTELTPVDAVICENNLDADTFTATGLIPNVEHTITFNINTDAVQTAVRTSDASGVIKFTAAEFSGVTPGNYNFNLSKIEVNGCELEITANNEIDVTVNPTPTFVAVTPVEAEICENDLTATTFNITGLLADAVHTVSFAINGGVTETAERTSNTDGEISFTAAEFSGGTVAPGTYEFVLSAISVNGCELVVESDNTISVIVKPAPTFAAFTPIEATICENNLDAQVFEATGLLAEAVHTVTFSINGVEQTAVRTSDLDGVIDFTAAEFSGVTPGDYVFVLSKIEVNGCELNVIADNEIAVTVNPTPTMASISVNTDSVCFDSREDMVITIDGLLDGENIFSYYIIRDGIEIVALRNDTLLATDGVVSFPVSDFTGASVIPGTYEMFIIGVQVNGCVSNFWESPYTVSVTLLPEGTIEFFTVSTESVCADQRDEAEFTIGGLLADREYEFNYSIKKEGVIISTKDYTTTSDVAGEVVFDGMIFKGASVVPGNYEVIINSVTLGTCVTTYAVDAPSASLELTGVPEIVKTKLVDTVYVGDACMANVPNYITNGTIAASACGGSVTVTQVDPIPGETIIGFGGERTIKFVINKTYVDGGSVEMLDSIKLYILDTTAPEANAKSGHEVFLDASGNATVSAADINNNSTDNCTPSGSLIVKIAKGEGTPGSSIALECLDLGEVSVKLYVTDASGNTSTAYTTVLVRDNIDPTIVGTLPNLTIDRGALCTNELANYASALSALTITDNCTSGLSNFTVEQTPLAGTIIAKSVSSHPVKLRVSDASGNFTDISFTITYEDNTAPVFSGISDVVLNAGENCNALLGDALAPISATDNCDETAIPVTYEVAGSVVVITSHVFEKGNTTVVVKATDSAGNMATSSFNVLVEDHTAPVLAGVPVDTIELEAGSACTAQLESSIPSITATDNCSEATITYTIGDALVADLSAYEFNSGSTEVYVTATDEDLNDVTQIFTVNVSDVTAPVFVGVPIETIAVNVNAAECSANYTLPTVTASDNCSEDLEIAITILNEDEEEVGVIDAGVVNLSVGIYSVHYATSDAAGNPQNASYELVVTNPLEATVTGTATVLKNSLTTSTVRFEGFEGKKIYEFTYHYIVDGDTVSTSQISSTLSLPVATIAQSNSVAGEFKYVLVSVRDANGCEVAVENQEATITVVEPQGVDLAPEVKLTNATLTSGVPRDVTFRIYNIGDQQSVGEVKFYVFKPKSSGFSMVMTSAGWAIESHPSYWLVTSTVDPNIMGEYQYKDVKVKMTYTGSDKGNTSLGITIPGASGGDTNSTNNAASRVININ